MRVELIFKIDLTPVLNVEIREFFEEIKLHSHGGQKLRFHLNLLESLRILKEKFRTYKISDIKRSKKIYFI
jgi:hypothetical protein